MQILDRTNFGCYVPVIRQIKATEDMPQSILDHRSGFIEQQLVEKFIAKVQARNYLINSEALLIFSDSLILSSDKLESALSKYLKAYEQKYLVCEDGGTSALLQLYKVQFQSLSGLEINRDVHVKVEQYMPQKLKTQVYLLQKIRTQVEKSIVNFISQQH